MTCLRTLLATSIAAVAFPALGIAQQNEGASPPSAEARSVAQAPTVDGDVLGDPVCRASRVLTGFWQTAPDEGQPSSERTEVRIVHTTDTLYFGVVCYDGDPSMIIVNESRRDSQLDEDDSFLIILDTYRDGQNGFVFGTNPAELEYDGQVANEGGGERPCAITSRSERVHGVTMSFQRRVGAANRCLSVPMQSARLVPRQHRFRGTRASGLETES
jgi:hypothetical protein